MVGALHQEVPLDSPAATALGKLSQLNLRFLEFVTRNPEALERAPFAALDAGPAWITYPLQAWPTFVRTEIVDEMVAATRELNRLIKAIPRRHFGLDPQRLAAYYRIDPGYAALLANLLSDPSSMDGLLVRSDSVKTAGGFRFLEVNMSSNLGGWKATVWVQTQLGLPVIQRFLAEQRADYSIHDSLESVLSHVIERACRKQLPEGELNIALVVPPDNRSGKPVWDYGQCRLEEVLKLRAPDLRGELIMCDFANLEERGGCIFAGDRRVHTLIEHHEGRVDPRVFRSMVMGNLDVYNGPLSPILADKRNLALLSDLAGAPWLDVAERAFVAKYLPWTREVVGGTTTFDGERVQLPDLLAAHREVLVLKPAGSSAGKDVQIGRRVGAAAWDAAVATALESPGAWVVQEHAESLPFLRQCGERGFAEHEIVWGFLLWGDSYGGGFLRMLPRDHSSGVINAARGAEEGAILQVNR